MMTRTAIGVLVVLAVSALVPISSTFGMAQVPDDSLWIVTKTLTDVGVHLPSSVDWQLAYQAGLPTHQELTVEWRSLPSSSAQAIKKEEAEKLTLRGDFTVVNRKEKVTGGSASRPPMFAPDQLTAIAVTDTNEVRGLVVFWDPRAWHSEDVNKGIRHGFVNPTVTFQLWLPDDPQIRSVVFFRPVMGDNGKPRLARIGEIKPLSGPAHLPAAAK